MIDTSRPADIVKWLREQAERNISIALPAANDTDLARELKRRRRLDAQCFNAAAMMIEYFTVYSPPESSDTNVAQLRKEWVEVWSATVTGSGRVIWFVEWCKPNGKTIVSDCATEDEALTAAKRWNLPILRQLPAAISDSDKH